MVQALLLTVLLVAGAGVLSSAVGSRWPLALLMVAILGSGVLRLDWRLDIWQPYRAIRPRHLLIGVVTVALLIGAYQWIADLPVLGWSLLTLVGQEGGNVVGAGLEFGPAFALPYLLLLLAVLPTLALVEESWFRRGTRGWGDGLVRSLLFGLVHTLVGVPVGVALFGLSAVGLLLTSVYLRAAARAGRDEQEHAFAVDRLAGGPAERAGMDASAVQHLAYNVVALCAGVALFLATLMEQN